MGVLRSTQSLAAEVEEMRAALQPAWSWRGVAGAMAAKRGAGADEGAAEARAVCVTGGISFLGLALVDRLLRHGYSVRLALETQEDLDKLREMDLFGENGRDGVWTIMANVMDPESLHRAFDGCVGVFHTSSLVDPGGISGYTVSYTTPINVPKIDMKGILSLFRLSKAHPVEELYENLSTASALSDARSSSRLQKHMATLEAKAAEQVVEACVRTESVRKCVFTSSLLACVWRQSHPHRRRFPATVDESCWSDETFCREKKLWFALGKTMAEKAAWRAARGRDLKLVTVCPALVTGPGFRRRNSTPSIAYLKGAHTMLAEGVLATADVERVAEAHVRVYEAMGGATAAGGRYICYDHVVRRAEEFTELERQLGLRPRAPPPPAAAPPSFALCNRKLARLVSSRRRCTHDAYLPVAYD